jgi:hypothetical protein
MLIEAAKQAGMKVPKDQDAFDPMKFPHFHVFCNVQLGRAMTSWTEHWDNAKVVAKISEKKLTTITLPEIIKMGLRGTF